MALVTRDLTPLLADLAHDFFSGPVRVLLLELVSLLLAVEDVGAERLLGLAIA